MNSIKQILYGEKPKSALPNSYPLTGHQVFHDEVPLLLTSLKKYYESVKKKFARVNAVGLLSDSLYGDLEPDKWSSPTVNPIIELDKLSADAAKQLGSLMYDKVFFEDEVL